MTVKNDINSFKDQIIGIIGINVQQVLHNYFKFSKKVAFVSILSAPLTFVLFFMKPDNIFCSKSGSQH